MPESDVSSNDSRYLAQALDLAAQGLGRVEPNPMVGAVLVRDERVVGRGWHQAFGGPHAEVHALRQAGPAAQGATLYVTLEPCCHHGKTPPCSDAVIAAGVVRVVAAMGDPFAAVAGGGFAQLRAAGLRVDVGLMEAHARQLNAPFIKRCLTGRPYVLAKWAQTLDGRLALTAPGTPEEGNRVPRLGPGCIGASRADAPRSYGTACPSGQAVAPAGRRWISSPQSRRLVHVWRSRMDGILIGLGTALADDPLLTVRTESGQTDYGRRPTRIVLDATLRLPVESKLAQSARQAPLIIACDEAADTTRARQLEDCGTAVLRLPRRTASPGSAGGWYGHESGPASCLALGQLLDELGRHGMTNVMVEGGAAVLGSFFRESLVDRVAVFVSPDLAGEATLPLAPGANTTTYGGANLPRHNDNSNTSKTPGDTAAGLGQALGVLRPTINAVGGDALLEGVLRDW